MRLPLLLCLIAIVTLAQQTPPPAGRGAAPILPNNQWVKLFNGTDLTGWQPVGAEKWVVENGVIHGYATTKAYGYLQTVKDYKDFQLSLRFKCVGDGNSGVFFHSAFKPRAILIGEPCPTLRSNDSP